MCGGKISVAAVQNARSDELLFDTVEEIIEHTSLCILGNINVKELGECGSDIYYTSRIFALVLLDAGSDHQHACVHVM